MAAEPTKEGAFELGLPLPESSNLRTISAPEAHYHQCSDCEMYVRATARSGMPLWFPRNGSIWLYSRCLIGREGRFLPYGGFVIGDVSWIDEAQKNKIGYSFCFTRSQAEDLEYGGTESHLHWPRD